MVLSLNKKNCYILHCHQMKKPAVFPECRPPAVEVRPKGAQPPSTPLVLKYYNPMYAVNYLPSNLCKMLSYCGQTQNFCFAY